MDEKIILELGHLEGITLRVRGRGVFPGILISLPRMDEENYLRDLADARQRLIQRAAEEAEVPTHAAKFKSRYSIGKQRIIRFAFTGWIRQTRRDRVQRLPILRTRTNLGQMGGAVLWGAGPISGEALRWSRHGQ